MRQRILHIENFGPVCEAAVELRPINVFIGEQSIGKSTVAKLIAIFTDYFSLCRLIQDGSKVWSALLKDYNLSVYQNDSYLIEYEIKELNRDFHIECRRDEITCRMKIADEIISDRVRIVSEMKAFEKQIAIDMSEFSSINTEGSSVAVGLTDSLYIPAERIIYSVLTNLMPALALANATIPKNMLRFMVELGNAKSEYPDFRIPMLNIAFRHEASEDSVVMEDDKKRIPMTAASSGIQSLVPLLLVLHYAVNCRDYKSFVIEEPECNLFPSKQVELLRYLIRTIRKKPRTLTITTHSPYLLAAMNNILFAGMLIEIYGEDIRKHVDSILSPDYQLKSHDCSVYSLGKEINGGEYCRSLLDEETGMIDYNSLDGVSERLGEEFDELQKTVLEFKRSFKG